MILLHTLHHHMLSLHCLSFNITLPPHHILLSTILNFTTIDNYYFTSLFIAKNFIPLFPFIVIVTTIYIIAITADGVANIYSLSLCPSGSNLLIIDFNIFNL